MASPTPTPKKIPVKGKPMGIPVWGWVIAAVIGIVVGYTILKKSPSGISGSSTGNNTDSGSAMPAEEGSEGGGSIALPLSLEDILSALGLRGSSATSPTPEATPPGLEAPLSEESPAQMEAQFSAEQESVSDPIVQQLVSQGIAITSEEQTIDSNIPGHEGETYLIPAGTPEFSLGNFNPNSPAGVLAMGQANQALGLWAPTTTYTAMPGSTPVSKPADFYDADNAAAVATFKPKPGGGSMEFF